jgi:hypothetical protein
MWLNVVHQSLSQPTRANTQEPTLTA